MSMMDVIDKSFKKIGFLQYSDQMNIIYEKRIDKTLFSQIKFNKDLATVTCATYELRDNGYEMCPLPLDEKMIKIIAKTIRIIKSSNEMKGEHYEN